MRVLKESISITPPNPGRLPDPGPQDNGQYLDMRSSTDQDDVPDGPAGHFSPDPDPQEVPGPTTPPTSPHAKLKCQTSQRKGPVEFDQPNR